MGCMCASERAPGKAEKNEKSRAAHLNKSAEEKKTLVRKKSKRMSFGSPGLRDLEVFRRIYEPFDTYYSLKTVLCEGETGKLENRVYVHTSIPCSVLTVSKKSKSQDTAIKKVRGEIESRTKLDHPQILTLYEVLHDEEQYYLITEPLIAEQLSSYVGSTIISERHVGLVGRGLLLALNYCHKLNIVHGKLNLGAVVLLSTPNFENIETKLTGFGRLDKVPTSDTGTGISDFQFLAPEAIKGTPTPASDVWSCGVILYTLLAGKPPFSKATDLKTLGKHHTRGISFSPGVWAKYSPEAVSLLESMLKKEPSERLTVQQCLEHPWFAHACGNLGQSSEQILGHLHRFMKCKSCNVLQEAIMKFIVTRIYPRNEISEYQRTFESVDSEFDGMISAAELSKWMSLSLPQDQVQPTVERLMGVMDSDSSGLISYTEFMMACIGHNAVLTDDYVKEAFLCFDKDQSGKVTIKEIKAFFSKKRTAKADKEWRELIKKADSSGDGQIEFSELKALLA